MNLDALSLKEGIRLMLSEEGRVQAALLNQRKRNRARPELDRPFASPRRQALLCRNGHEPGSAFWTRANARPPSARRLNSSKASSLVDSARFGKRWKARRMIVEPGREPFTFESVTKRMLWLGSLRVDALHLSGVRLEAAKRRHAATILLCFNPPPKVTGLQKPNLVIAPAVGPEVLTGSTRLKCGTATKIILNLFTTLAMVKLGKVTSNLMVDLEPSNAKLRDRAVRIVRELTGCDAKTAWSALEKSHWTIQEACRRLRKIERKLTRAARQYLMPRNWPQGDEEISEVF
jgi:hypothetical protein